MSGDDTTEAIRGIEAELASLSSAVRSVARHLGEMADPERDRLPEFIGKLREGELSHHTARRLLQILPLAPTPAVYAIFRTGLGGADLREPVVAWGLWDEWEEARGAGGRLLRRTAPVRYAGPLVLDNGLLIPAEESGEHYGNSFEGVRYGDYLDTQELRGFDAASADKGREPLRDSTPPPAPNQVPRTTGGESL